MAGECSPDPGLLRGCREGSGTPWRGGAAPWRSARWLNAEGPLGVPCGRLGAQDGDVPTRALGRRRDRGSANPLSGLIHWRGLRGADSGSCRELGEARPRAGRTPGWCGLTGLGTTPCPRLPPVPLLPVLVGGSPSLPHPVRSALGSCFSLSDGAGDHGLRPAGPGPEPERTFPPRGFPRAFCHSRSNPGHAAAGGKGDARGCR